METTWGNIKNTLKNFFKIVDNVDNLFWLLIFLTGAIEVEVKLEIYVEEFKINKNPRSLSVYKNAT